MWVHGRIWAGLTVLTGGARRDVSGGMQWDAVGWKGWESAMLVALDPMAAYHSTSYAKWNNAARAQKEKVYIALVLCNFRLPSPAGDYYRSRHTHYMEYTEYTVDTVDTVDTVGLGSTYLVMAVALIGLPSLGTAHGKHAHGIHP
jgi:hypothetical protein